MIREKKEKSGPIIIDLTGPNGNAFYLLAMARKLAKSLGWTENKIDHFLDKMQSGDYENLIQVFDDAFGEWVILER